jgi:hypothetical protein
MAGFELADDLRAAAPVLVLAVILILFGVLPRGRRFLSAPRRHRYWTNYRSSNRSSWRNQDRAPDGTDRTDLTDAAQQLAAVMAGTFRKRRVMSASEYRVFKIIEDDLPATRSGYRVFAQTSLGEILESPSEDAFSSINSKRADILVVDRSGWPVLAVEYQGSGHYQGSAAARDAVKKEALRKAGVRYLEIAAGDTDDHIRSRVREHLV